MFYSKELLGKKAPLGAIWFAAHGKKLRKENILRVNIVKTCEKILDPDVPQALRLQGILIGGLTVIFGKQQYYLLEDCNDMMRKLQAMMVNDSGNTLNSNKRNARLDAITMDDFEDHLPDEHFTLVGMPGAHGLNMEDDGLLPILTGEPGGSPDNLEVGAGYNQYRLSLDAGLNLDLPYHTEQPELFDLPEPEDGLLAGIPDQQPSPGANLDADQLPGPDGDLPYDPEAEQQHVPTEEPDPQQDDAPAPAQPSGPNADLPVSHDMPAELNNGAGADVVSRSVGGGPQEEEAQGQVRQAKRRSRKRRNALIVDDIERIVIHSHDFRQWMLDHSDLISARPRKSARRGPHPGDLGKQPATAAWGGGPWAGPLQSLFTRRLVECNPPAAAQDGQQAAHGGLHPQASPDPAHSPPPALVHEDDFPLDQGPPAADDAFVQYDDLPPDVDVAPREPLHADDLPIGEAEDPAVERLRAALESPENELDISLAQLNLGYTPDTTSRQRGGRTGTGSSRRRSVARPESDQASDRSGSKGRLDDLVEDADFLGNLAVEGDPDDMLPAVPEGDLEGVPTSSKRRRTGPGPLTQFQANGGSLLEDSAPDTQAMPSPTMDQKTCAMLQVLQDRFKERRQAGDEDPYLRFSSLSQGLSRAQSAKLLYQIMVSHGLGIIRAEQGEPYSDILIRAASLKLSSQDMDDGDHDDGIGQDVHDHADDRDGDDDDDE